MEIAKAAAELQVETDKKFTMSCQDFWSFAHKIREGFGTHEPYVRNLVEMHDMIFLDDVGKIETDAGWIRDSFRELVDGVFNFGEGKSLCFTSNLSRAGLSELYGEPCLDRVDEICYSVKMDGRSFR